jgi:hypothetical protein
MKKFSALRFCLLPLALLCLPAWAEDKVVRVPVRAEVTLPVFWMPRDDASATVLLVPGGAGGFGVMAGGKSGSANFLVRSRDHFAAQGFNVAVLGRPSDTQDMDYAYRTSDEHVADLAKIVATIKQWSDKPVWMAGTSRGTVSTIAAAVAFGNEQLAGIVLSSSIVNMKKPGALPAQRLEAIHIPVLVLHHEKDACIQCAPQDVPRVMSGLVNAPVKKLVMVNGGADPSGDTCGALHWHGYIGMEQEAVGIITDWIRKPVP